MALPRIEAVRAESLYSLLSCKIGGETRMITVSSQNARALVIAARGSIGRPKGFRDQFQ
jgi:hypothetical protein